MKVAKRRGCDVALEVFSQAVGYPFLVQLLLLFQIKGLCSVLNVHAFRQLLILQFAMSINKLSEMCTWQEGNQQVPSATAKKSLL